MTLDELTALEVAEEARKRKAAAMPKVEIPPPITETVEERMNKLGAKIRMQEQIIDVSRNEDRKSELLKAANLPKRHERKTLDFSNGPWKTNFEAICKKLGTGFLVALIGIRGAGKTQMGVELVR